MRHSGDMTNSLPAGLNDFLFSAIASDSNGMHLTMLTALARSGVDPWEEAAGLRALSRDDATDKLVHMFASVPNGPARGDEAATLAARLVVLLHSAPKALLKPVSATVSASDREELRPPRSLLPPPVQLKRAIYALLALTVVVIGYRMLNSMDAPAAEALSTQQPR